MANDSKNSVSVARYLVSRIEELVAVVPFIQGGAVSKLVDEVGQSKKLKYICPNHEQALAMMVDAYARVRGFGIGMVTSGPGGTNLATGLGCAYYDSVPCLLITGQVGMFHVKGQRRVRQRGFQETDIISVLKPLTKWSVLLDDPAQTRCVFEKAVYLAKAGRPGPVHIDVPFNVQRAVVNPMDLKGFDPSELSETMPEPHAIAEEILKELRSARKPVILAGGGVKISGTGSEFLALARALEVPMVATWTAADIFDNNDPLYLGHPGRLGNKSAVEAIQRSDFLLALGTRFPARVVVNEKDFAKRARIVAVDADAGELADGLIVPQRAIAMRLEALLPKLAQAARQAEPLEISEWRSEVAELKKGHFKIDGTTHQDAGHISPYVFLAGLSELLPENAIIIPDCGSNLTWVMQAYQPKPGQHLFSAWGHSPMGYSLPAALGAQLAAPGRPVVALIGDGGMQMNIQELQTIAVNKLPVKVFILNNECYANTKFPSRDQFEGRSYGNEPGFGYAAPDFVKIIQAYGLPVKTITGRGDWRQEIKDILKASGPMFADVRIHPEQFVHDLGSNLS